MFQTAFFFREKYEHRHVHIHIHIHNYVPYIYKIHVHIHVRVRGWVVGCVVVWCGVVWCGVVWCGVVWCVVVVVSLSLVFSNLKLVKDAQEMSKDTSFTNEKHEAADDLPSLPLPSLFLPPTLLTFSLHCVHIQNVSVHAGTTRTC